MHRSLKAFLVKGKGFGLAEVRCNRFASEEEVKGEKIRTDVNCNTLEDQDFGPTVLILEKKIQRRELPNQGTVDSQA